MRPRRQRRPRRRPVDLRKGVFILPNLFTSGGLFCGFASIIFSIQGRFEYAAWVILVSHVFDGLDGRIARFTHSTSRFGMEYDSLADLIAFGMAPAVLMYRWALYDFGKWGWLAAFLFLAAGALRLARFNVQSGTIENKWFLGLPIPAAADVVVLTVLLFYYLGWEKDVIRPRVLLGALLGLSFLMVSTIRFWSLKNINFQQKRSVWWLVLLVALGVVAAAEPEPVLFSVALAYALSGPALFLLRKVGIVSGAQARAEVAGTMHPHLSPRAEAGERRPYLVVGAGRKTATPGRDPSGGGAQGDLKDGGEK